MSIATAKHHKGIPLNGGGGASPASAVPQHSHRGGEHSGPVGPQHASSGRPDKGFLGFDANGGAPMNHIYGYGYGHGRPDPFNDIDHQKLMNGGLSREAARTEAQQLWRENKTINSRGQIVPKGNFSQREINQHAAATAAAHAGKAEASKGSASDTGKAGASKVGMSEDEIKNAFKGDATPSAPESAPAQGLASTYPVDPSTVRQPVAPVGDGEHAKDSQGNRASDSNPPVGTPAEFRQMSRDAANGRSTNRTVEGANIRQTISSKYGGGSSMTPQAIPQKAAAPAANPSIAGPPVPAEGLARARLNDFNNKNPAAGEAGASKVGMSDDEIKNAFKGDTTPAATPARPSPDDGEDYYNPSTPKGYDTPPSTPAEIRQASSVPSNMPPQARDAQPPAAPATAAAPSPSLPPSKLTPDTQPTYPKGSFEQRVQSLGNAKSTLDNAAGAKAITDMSGPLAPTTPVAPPPTTSGGFTGPTSSQRTTPEQDAADLARYKSEDAANPPSTGYATHNQRTTPEQDAADLARYKSEDAANPNAGMRPEDIRQSAASTGPAPDGGAGSSVPPAGFKQQPLPTAANPNAGMGPAAIRQSAAGAPAATVAQNPMDPDQQALADAKKQIKKADPGEDPNDVIKREAQGEDDDED